MRTGYTTRLSAQRALKEHPSLISDPLTVAWARLVSRDEITWDRVMSYEETGIRETGYDLTVPGFETFMSVNGVVLSNTMQIHVPVTQAGIEDAKKMTLSRLLFSDMNPRALNVKPEMESVTGLHRATQPSSDTKTKSFASTEDALAAYHRGQVAINDPVKIDK